MIVQKLQTFSEQVFQYKRAFSCWNYKEKMLQIVRRLQYLEGKSIEQTLFVPVQYVLITKTYL